MYDLDQGQFMVFGHPTFGRSLMVRPRKRSSTSWESGRNKVRRIHQAERKRVRCDRGYRTFLYVVGERLDCSGMRWKLGGAEPLLQLRCIELNGDWDEFIAWATDQTTAEMKNGKLIIIRHPRPKPKSRTKKRADTEASVR